MSLYNQRRQYRRSSSSISPTIPWWLTLQISKPSYTPISWFHRCTYCNTYLLNSERNGWCCNQGKYLQGLSSLSPLPTTISELCNNHEIQFSWLSRHINSLYAFTAIGITGEFIHFTGLSNIAITRRIYHRMLDLQTTNHSLHWFLYDENGRNITGD